MKILQVLQLLKMYWPVFPLVFLAGLIDAIAGGGGLISLPAYMIAGLPPHQAIATNKMSSSLGTALSDPFCNFRLYTSADSLVCGTLCACRLMGGLQSESDDQQRCI